MITELTKEQEEQLDVYAERGIQRALACDPLDAGRAEAYAKKLMKFIGRPYQRTIIADGPYEAWLIICELSAGYNVQAVNNKVNAKVDANVDAKVYNKVRAKVDNKVSAEVSAKVKDKVYDKVYNKVSAKVDAKVYDKVNAKVDAKVYDKVRAKVDNKVYAKVYDKVRAKVDAKVRALSEMPSFVSAYCCAYWWAGFCAWCDYLREVLDVDLPDYSVLSDVIDIGMVWPLDDTVVVCGKPQLIHTNEHGLHCDGGPALAYADGTQLFCLNGVAVPEDIAVPHHATIPVQRWVQEKNVEVKREIIRKVGIERIYNELGATVVDSLGEYELIDMKLTDEITGRYLKMVNPSIDTIHIEGVPSECMTVADALHSRKPKKMRDLPVSDDGDDWYQQGDVCIWPKGATSLKPEPCILT